MYFLLACLTYHAKRFIEQYAKCDKGEREEYTFEYQKRFAALNNNCQYSGRRFARQFLTFLH